MGKTGGWNKNKIKADLFKFSLANTGVSISNHSLIQSADIIHIHWTQQGFLSLKELKNLQRLGKPVIWTLHDMWAFTGGCHYSEGCLKYKNECGKCPMLKDPKIKDLSSKVWNRKKNAYQNIHFITCSKWLAGVAKSSSLLFNSSISPIANPIDTEIFKPLSTTYNVKNISTNKKLILFGAMNLQDERKGYRYFLESLLIIKSKYPELSKDIELLTFGKAKKGEENNLPFKINYCGFLSDPNEIAKVYGMASAFVLPSLEDNLPNTVMESMACGTPVIAFKAGGIPEMVLHEKNGYLSEYKSAQDLAEGINWVLENPERYKAITEEARKYVLTNYTFEIIGKKHQHYYEELLS